MSLKAILNRARRSSPSADPAGRASVSAMLRLLRSSFCCEEDIDIVCDLGYSLSFDALEQFCLDLATLAVGGGSEAAVHLTGQLGCLYYTYVNVYVHMVMTATHIQ